MNLSDKMKLVLLDIEKEFESHYGIYVEQAEVSTIDDQLVEDFKDDGFPDWFIDEYRKGYCCLGLGISVEHENEAFMEFNEGAFQKKLKEIFSTHLPEECIPDHIDYSFGDQEFMTNEYKEACKKLKEQEQGHIK